MRQITQQQIQAWAPNPAAAQNGQKISQKGGFVRLERSADDTFYLGECTGSGKSNYIASADFIDEAAPVFRCSCPSRQFPCKHSIALMYEVLAGKNFGICEIPEDIQRKRRKRAAGEDGTQTMGGKERPEAEGSVPAVEKAVPKAKGSQAARLKKIRKQLEGLELVGKLIRDLMRSGLGAMGGTALGTYLELSRQLGDYYLPGPQRILNQLILEIQAFQKDAREEHYDAAIRELERLNSLVKKSSQYLQDKLEREDAVPDDNLLYEELGGVWKLTELKQIGCCRQEERLLQLAFWVTYDEARKEYIDTGCWVDPDTGEVVRTLNYRPIKALKYVKQEDSVFETALVKEAAWYPGGGNRRVRWESAQYCPAQEADYEKVYDFGAVSLGGEVKSAKNYLKDALAEEYEIRLIRFAQIGGAEGGEGCVLKTEGGETILLKDMSALEPAVEKLFLLPDVELLKGQVLLGAFYYDRELRRLCIHPLSIVTRSRAVRLLY